jgi:hypothetical protein
MNEKELDGIMKEKLRRGEDNYFESGIFKPKGKLEKRRIHKLVRKQKEVFRSITNRVGTFLYLE